MFHIVLYQPEIPPNTGNVIRLAANTGSTLTLIEPLGFELDDTRLKRAGLDYHEFANIQVCKNIDEVLEMRGSIRVHAFTTKGTKCLSETEFQENDTLLFGSETRGLPKGMRDRFAETCVRIPMLPDSRSVNLSNAVAIAVYEAWRQQQFKGKD